VSLFASTLLVGLHVPSIHEDSRLQDVLGSWLISTITPENRPVIKTVM